MERVEVFSTKIPRRLKQQLDLISQRTGLRKNRIVEDALREKLEDILDAEDLREAIREASGFHPWRAVRKRLG